MKLNKQISRTATANRLFIATIVGLALLPFVGPIFVPVYYTLLMVDAMALAIFALGYDIPFGYVNLISFGHAAYFGLGVYGAALSLIYISESVLVMLVIALLASSLFAIFVSVFSLRSTGVYFAILTFAFAQIIYEIAIRMPEITGGTDGFGTPTPTIFGVPFTSQQVYFVTLGFLALSYLSAKRLMNSPLGLILKSIGENNQRTQLIGYNTRRYKEIAFTISGAYSGLAGALFLLNHTYAAPQELYWLTSGEVIIMTLLGGMGTLFGPMIGAAVFIYLQDFLSTLTGDWQIYIGLIFVIVVLFFPNGLVGIVKTTNRFNFLNRSNDEEN